MRYMSRHRCGLVVKDFIFLKNRHQTEEVTLPLLVTEMLDVTYETTATSAYYRERGPVKKVPVLRTEHHGFLKTYEVN